MKRNFFSLPAFVLLACLAPLVLFAGDGTWTNNAVESYKGYNLEIKFECSVDTTDTLTSNAFRLSKFDNVNWTSFPFTVHTLVSSTLGSPKVSVYIEGYEPINGTWAVIDTLFEDRTAETVLTSTVDLNNTKREQYRFVIYGVALNRSDTLFKSRMLCYQEEY